MKRLNKKTTLINILASLLLQIITIISGFIIPKITLSYFGSDVNGLVSSISQFLNYITVVEGGLTGVIMANLYKPLYEKDSNKLSSIILTADKFYKKIGFIFIFYTIVLSVIYPLFFTKSFDYLYIQSLIIILSMTMLIQYMFSLTIRNLLVADNKLYIVSITQSVIIIFNIIFAYISIKIYPNIHIFKFISGALYIIQPLIFNKFYKRYYCIDNHANIDKELLKGRWDGFSINIAAFIHNGTDATVLTLFTNFSTVSVYGVYSLVSSGLKQLVVSISSGLNPMLGKAYAKGNALELKEKIDIYEYIIYFLVFYLFSIAALLITPFVMIYTKNITDTNYYQPLFGVLLLIAEGLYLIKFPHMNLAYSAKKFKETSKPAFVEALLNIVISLILVKKYGLIGVAIGTIVAMIYRMIFHVNMTSKITNLWKSIGFYKKLIIFSISSFIGIIICIFCIPSIEYNVLSWITHGLIYAVIFGVIYVLISLVFFKKEFDFLYNYIKKK